jgi:hypothetical protein
MLVGAFPYRVNSGNLSFECRKHPDNGTFGVEVIDNFKTVGLWCELTYNELDKLYRTIGQVLTEHAKPTAVSS